MSRKLFPVLCKDFLPCPLYTHRFLILCCQRKQYCDFVVMASVLTADNGICPAVHNFFCPRKIFFSLVLLHWKILLPPLEIIPKYTYLAYTVLLSYSTFKMHGSIGKRIVHKADLLRDARGGL